MVLASVRTVLASIRRVLSSIQMVLASIQMVLASVRTVLSSVRTVLAFVRTVVVSVRQLECPFEEQISIAFKQFQHPFLTYNNCSRYQNNFSQYYVLTRQALAKESILVEKTITEQKH